MTENPILATEGQRRLEATARRLLASGPVREAISATEELYRGHAMGATPTGAATVHRAAHSIGVASVQYALSEDPVDPVLLWSVTGPHRFGGLELPRSGFGIENPDNVYRNATVHGDHRYEIRGKLGPQPPAELHFEMRAALPGTTAMGEEGGVLEANLAFDAIVADADGDFTVALDALPVGDRANHIAIPAGRTSLLLVRDLLDDWSSQLPTRLELVRLDPPPAPHEPDEAVLAERAAEILRTIAPFWIAYFDQYSYGARPLNTVPDPRVRPGGRGMSTGGHFRLDDDEALVVTLDPLGARSLGIQITDPWGVAYEYIHRSSSLNTAQAAANEDGTYTFVIATADPGVRNWLDPQGFDAGLIAVRWQAIVDARPEGAVRDCRVVPLSGLGAALPGGAARTDEVERDLRNAARASDYMRRYL